MYTLYTMNRLITAPDRSTDLILNIFMIIGIVILELLLIIIISVLKWPFPIKYILSKTHYTSNLKVDFTFKSRDAITSE